MVYCLINMLLIVDLIRSDTFGDVDAYIKEKEVAQGSKSTTRVSRVKNESNSTR